ncbi:peptidylprolyl isomerase, partial [Vibrio genomosp. F10]
GYAVFGKVSAGMDVVQDISSLVTETRNGYDDVPNETVIIEKVVIQPD